MKSNILTLFTIVAIGHLCCKRLSENQLEIRRVIGEKVELGISMEISNKERAISIGEYRNQLGLSPLCTSKTAAPPATPSLWSGKKRLNLWSCRQITRCSSLFRVSATANSSRRLTITPGKIWGSIPLRVTSRLLWIPTLISSLQTTPSPAGSSTAPCLSTPRTASVWWVPPGLPPR